MDKSKGPTNILMKSKIIVVGHKPEKVFLDTADRKHTAHITSRTDQLDAQMCAFFDDLISIVGILRRRSIWIPFNVARYQLWRLALWTAAREV